MKWGDNKIIGSFGPTGLSEYRVFVKDAEGTFIDEEGVKWREVTGEVSIEEGRKQWKCTKCHGLGLINLHHDVHGKLRSNKCPKCKGSNKLLKDKTAAIES